MASRGQQARAVLEACPLFAELRGDEIAALAAEVDWVTLPAGEVLIREGDPADALYVVAWGRLTASQIGSEGRPVPLGEMGRGGFVGELALVSGARRSATLRALRDSAFLRLSRESFDRLVVASPQAALGVARTIAARYAAPRRKPPAGTGVTLALVPANDGLPTRDLAAGLFEALQRLGAAALLSPDVVAAELGPDVAEASVGHPDHARLGEWLDQREQESRYLLYVAPEAEGVWFERCLRQADRVVALGRAELLPGPGWGRLADVAQVRRVELALLHQGSPLRWEPRPEWLDQLRLHAHHHLRAGADCEADLGRLARRLTDRAVGVALGGGGTRSTAYVGVLRALAEAGVPVDLVAGVSGGSVVGSMAALGLDDREMSDGLKVMLYGNTLKDIGPPLVSLLSGRGWTRVFREVLGEARLECLTTEFLAVTSDLTTLHKVIPRRGRLWRAALASGTLPGWTPPVEVEGHLLVDGGLLTLLPTEDLRGPCAEGQVIALNAGAPPLQPTRTRYGTVLSGWRLLAAKLNPLAETNDLPPLREIVLSAACLHAAEGYTAAAANADLLLELPMSDLSLLGVDTEEKIDSVIERGYEFAKAPIERWLESQEASESCTG